MTTSTSAAPKLSKSTGNTVDPVALAATFGTDALRWWIGREVPLLGDTEFTTARLAQAYNTDLANGLGNLANRTGTLLTKYYNGHLLLDGEPVRAPGWDSTPLDTACAALPSAIDTALGTADFRSATACLVAVVDRANRLLNAAEPWKLLKTPEADPAATHRLLSRIVHMCRILADELTPFCPGGASRLARQLGTGERIQTPEPAFTRIA